MRTRSVSARGGPLDGSLFAFTDGSSASQVNYVRIHTKSGFNFGIEIEKARTDPELVREDIVSGWNKIADQWGFSPVV